jgi:IclR family acetate operon transcriptional repressor
MANVDMIQYKTVQSMEKTLGILEILPDDPEEGLGITEIAERLSHPESTAHRIVSTLVHRGFALQNDRRAFRKLWSNTQGCCFRYFCQNGIYWM